MSTIGERVKAGTREVWDPSSRVARRLGCSVKCALYAAKKWRSGRPARPALSGSAEVLGVSARLPLRLAGHGSHSYDHATRIAEGPTRSGVPKRP